MLKKKHHKHSHLHQDISKPLLYGVLIVGLLFLSGTSLVLNISKQTAVSPTPTPTPKITQPLSCDFGQKCPKGFACQEVSACPSTKPGQVHCMALVLQCVKQK